MRIYIIAALALAIMAAGAGIYRAGQSSEQAKQQQQITKTKDRINEAISDGVGANWRDRVLGAQ